jgi:hypothetical protein
MHETNETNASARAYMEQTFQWSEPKLIPTGQGERRVRTTKVGPEHPFWRKIWQDPRRQRIMLSLGITVSNVAKGHELMWFSNLTEQELQKREQSQEMSRATEANIEVPTPEGRTFRPYQLAGIAFTLHRIGALKTTQDKQRD